MLLSVLLLVKSCYLNLEKVLLFSGCCIMDLTEYSKKMMTKSFKKTKYLFTETPPPHFGEKLGVYLHVPFCHTKCTFCPFYKELYNQDLKEKYVDALITEISNTPIGGNAEWVYFVVEHRIH
jgi:coproporphyrinogen III oxidase-like Fe-S oxidoreductase